MKKLGKHQKIILAAAAILGIGSIGVVALTAKPASKEDTKAEVPVVVVEEDFWAPLAYDPFDIFAALERHYARNEMKAAAHEITRARSWLMLAAEKALPDTQKKLENSAKTLKKLSAKLDKGLPLEAAELQSAIASAEQSLAEMHYDKSRAFLAKEDDMNAARHLRAAAAFLKTAADDIRYGYPEDTLVWFDWIDGIGWQETDVVDLSAKKISSNLDKLNTELNQLSKALVDWEAS